MGHGCHDCGTPNGCECPEVVEARRRAFDRVPTVDEHRAAMLKASAADTRTEIVLDDMVETYETEALRFAFYPPVTRQRSAAAWDTETVPVYPTMALLGELGEVCEKIVEGAPAADIIKELGDALWYVAANARDLKLGLVRVVGAEAWGDMPFEHRLVDRGGRALEVETIALKLVAAAGRFAEQRCKKPWRDSTAIDRVAASRDLREVVKLMRAVANEYGQTLGQVAQANIDKLVARRRRGTLTGSGDNR